jgi:hypothetical protein
LTGGASAGAAAVVVAADAEDAEDATFVFDRASAGRFGAADEGALGAAADAVAEALSRGNPGFFRADGAAAAPPATLAPDARSGAEAEAEADEVVTAGSPFAAAAAAALSFLLLIPTARFVAFERRFSGDLFFAGGGSATASAEVIASSRACRRGDPRDQLMPESMTLRGSQLAPRASSEMATMDRPAPSSRPPAPRARHRRRVRSTPPTPPPPTPTPREFARCTST